MKDSITKLDNILGKAVTELILEDLQERGISFTPNHTYSEHEIKGHLELIIGEDAASLLIERIFR